VSGHDWYWQQCCAGGLLAIRQRFMYSTKNPILRGDTIKAESGPVPNLRTSVRKKKILNAGTP
jgi:hypothetical protein